jgi:hypothetical protein
MSFFFSRRFSASFVAWAEMPSADWTCVGEHRSDAELEIDDPHNLVEIERI